MFTIDIKKEVKEIANQVYKQSGTQLEDPVLALMEYSMKMGVLKAGLSLIQFTEESEE